MKVGLLGTDSSCMGSSWKLLPTVPNGIIRTQNTASTHPADTKYPPHLEGSRAVISRGIIMVTILFNPI